MKQNWPQNGIAEEKNEAKFIYVVSATVHISDHSAPKRQLSVPFFSCPRRYSDASKENHDEFRYVRERFEESDLLPPLAIAMAGETLDKAFEVFLAAFSPRDTSLTALSPGLESMSCLVCHSNSRCVFHAAVYSRLWRPCELAH